MEKIIYINLDTFLDIQSQDETTHRKCLKLLKEIQNQGYQFYIKSNNGISGFNINDDYSIITHD